MSYSLEDFLWVLPGITFLFSYNRLRDVESEEFSGWPYFFFIVVVGTITFLPAKFLLDLEGPLKNLWFAIIASAVAFLIPFLVKYFFSFFIEKLDENQNFFMPSNLWSIIYFFYPLENRDKFIKNCMENDGELILVTVNEPLLIGNKEIKTTTFFGVLIEFPYVATSVVDSHVIRILPLLSGYRFIDETSGRENIRWVQKYKIREDS